MPSTVSSLSILDAEQARHRALNAALAGPLPHLEITDRAQCDRRDAIPHIDADAVRQAILIDRADRLAATASRVAGVAAAVIGLGAGAQVVSLFVGGAL